MQGLEVAGDAVELFDACQQQARRLVVEVTVGLLDPVAHPGMVPAVEDVKAAVYLQQQQRPLSFLGLGIQAGRQIWRVDPLACQLSTPRQ
jgi:hypothetical protein